MERFGVVPILVIKLKKKQPGTGVFSVAKCGRAGRRGGGGWRAGAHLVEDPDLPVDGGPGHPVAVVVEEDPLLLGIPAQGRAQLLHFVHGRIEALLVPGLWQEKWVRDWCWACGDAWPTCALRPQRRVRLAQLRDPGQATPSLVVYETGMRTASRGGRENSLTQRALFEKPHEDHKR